MTHVEIDPLVFSIKRPGGVARLWTSLIENFRNKGLDFSLSKQSGLPIAWRRQIPRKTRAALYVPTLLRPSSSAVKNVHVMHDCIKETTYPAWKAKLIRGRRKWLFERSTMLICVSYSTRDDVVEIYGESVASKIVVIPNPVDVLKIRSLASEGSINALLLHKISGRRFSVYIGTRSGIKNFAEALTLLIADRELHLVVIGPPATEVEKRTFGRFQNRIHFVGNLVDADMFCLLSKSEFLFFPSLTEGFGMPIVESIALGVPVIGLNTKINNETSGGGVRTYQAGQVESLAQTIGEMQSGYDRSKMIQNAELQRFDPNRVADKYINAFQQALSH